MTIRTATATRIWRESDGGFRWQAGQVFGTADDETEAREAARRTANAASEQTNRKGRKRRGTQLAG